MFKLMRKNDKTDAMGSLARKSTSKKITAADYQVQIGEEIAPYLVKFSAVVAELKKELQPDFDKVVAKGDIGLTLDELFILRHVLSEKGNKKKIIAAIRKGLEWRASHLAILQTLTMSPDGSDFEAAEEGSELRKKFDFIKNHLAIGLIDGFPTLPHPLFVIRGQFNMQKTIMKNIDRDAVKLYLLLQTEFYYRIVDERTRKTGTWVKVINVIDAKNFGPFKKEFDFKFFRVIGENSKDSDYLHPQLLAKKVALNVPSVLLTMIKFFKRFMSKRAMEKLGICLGSNIGSRTDAGEVCPFVKKHNLASFLPHFMGGTATCPAALLKDEVAEEDQSKGLGEEELSKKMSEMLKKEEKELAETEIDQEIVADLD